MGEYKQTFKPKAFPSFWRKGESKYNLISKTMAQAVKLEFKRISKDYPFLVLQSYEYGTGKEYKTLTSAIKQAEKDFKKETKNALNDTLNYIGVYRAFRVVTPFNDGVMIHRQVELKS